MMIAKVEGRTWFVEDELDEFMPPGADTPEGLFRMGPGRDDAPTFWRAHEDGTAMIDENGNFTVCDVGDEIALTYQDESETLMVAFSRDGTFRVTEGDGTACNTFGLADSEFEWDPRGSLVEIAEMLVEERFFDGDIPADEPLEVEAFYAAHESILFRFCEPVDGAPRLDCLTPERINAYGAAQLPLGS